LEDKATFEVVPKSFKKIKAKWDVDKDDNRVIITDNQLSALQKGKYDIDYVLTLLRILTIQCEQLRHRPKEEMYFSLKESINRLMSMLQTEKEQMNAPVNPHISLTCPNCHKEVIILKSEADHYQCPCTKKKKLISW
jgi:hypothetical protein